MSIRVGINGFGRMGKLGLRAGWEFEELEVVHRLVDEYLRGTRAEGFSSEEAEKELSPEVRERLRQLGYIH